MPRRGGPVLIKVDAASSCENAGAKPEKRVSARDRELRHMPLHPLGFDFRSWKLRLLIFAAASCA